MRLAFVLLAACTQEHYYALDDLPATEWTAGLPVSGDGHLIVWIARPPDDWTRAVGFVRFSCTLDCMLGDDRASMKLSMLDEPIQFGRLALGDVRAELDFADGHVTMTTRWRSPDFELDARVRGTLAKRATDIEFDGCIVFRPTDALRARDPRMHALVSLTGAPTNSQDHYTIRIEGTLGKMRRLGQQCDVALR